MGQLLTKMYIKIYRASLWVMPGFWVAAILVVGLFGSTELAQHPVVLILLGVLFGVPIFAAVVTVVDPLHGDPSLGIPEQTHCYVCGAARDHWEIDDPADPHG